MTSSSLQRRLRRIRDLLARGRVAQATDLIESLHPADQADVLGDLDQALTDEMLVAMHEADGVRPLLLHPDETAGGLITSEYLVFPQEMRAGPALNAIKEWEPKGAESSYLFLVDATGLLIYFSVATLVLGG